MRKVRTFTVKPSLPEELQDLSFIANNLFWTWNSEYTELFTRIDRNLWEQCHHNPVKLLGSVSQARLEDLARNEGFVYQLSQAAEKLKETLAMPTWYDKVYAKNTRPVIAYFSAEFGIHESVPIYSGGLGMLAGDHLKSASDLGVPLVGIGLMYQKGYFRQYLNTDGWQQEHYIDNDFHNMPIELIRKDSERPLTVSVQFPGRNIIIQIWKAQVGRVTLYLLDTNVPANTPEDRLITRSLYGGDVETRITQEIILGIGGFKALRTMDIEPTVCHMNEGHAAFMSLERVREMRNAKSMTFEEAAEATKSSNVFTVHTPVAAGSDEFSVELIDKYFGSFYGKLGLNREQFLALGRKDEHNDAEPFKMPVLAIKMSAYRNGVSQLHGEVSQKIWSELWPELPLDEVPIKAVTNGVHAKTWLSSEMNSLYERYLGANWSDEIVDKSIWQNMDQVPDEEIWRIHQRCKERLVAYARKCLRKQLQRRGAFHTELGWADEVLNPEALTIGFARRFATYKRGNLLLRDTQRLIKLLSDSEKPIQFIFAGKAHPKDTAGKEIIRQIVHFAKQNNVCRKIVFLEDYDMDVARYLVQGVDVWLNNPRRPMEASGTSGMKAAINGILNMSTLDGWWCEGYVPEAGWVIGAGEEYDDLGYQDAVESNAIFNLLEKEVVPLFYSRSGDGLPRQWIRSMKNTIKWCAPRFNTSRMVAEYTRKFYNPAAARWRYLTASAMSRVRALSMWKHDIKNAWDELSIDNVDVQIDDGNKVCDLSVKQPQLEVGSNLVVKAKIRLGKLNPEDVAVEIYYGVVDSTGNIEKGQVSKMQFANMSEDNEHAEFNGTIPCRMSGQHGFALRLLPQHADLAEQFEPGMIMWESPK
ncbi:MAG: alpha-glucan family phosphorylase [Phycisphaerae bacterium]|nr:alpha-glucan family phosphorylase [Phycisphaerae bacterium]